MSLSTVERPGFRSENERFFFAVPSGDNITADIIQQQPRRARRRVDSLVRSTQPRALSESQAKVE